MNFEKVVECFVLHQVKNSDSFLREIHPDDLFYQQGLGLFNGRHHRALFRYYATGHLFSQIVQKVITEMFGETSSISCLHFKSGFGCLTRFLTEFLPAEQILVTDISFPGIEFQTEKLGVNGRVTMAGIGPNLVQDKFDLIVVGYSSADRDINYQELSELLELLTERGCLIFASGSNVDVELEDQKFLGNVGCRVIHGWGDGESLSILSRGKLDQLKLTGVPGGQRTGCKLTETGELWLNGWVTEGVAKIEIFLQDRLISTVVPSEKTLESDSQKRLWSSVCQLETYSRQDTLLIRILDQDNLMRVIELCPLSSITFLYPKPPRDLVHAISGSFDVDAFMTSLPNLRYQVRRYLRMAGLDFNQFNQILDFGCGVGRFLFAFESELTENQHLWGCDVSPECAQWCAENIDFATIKQNEIVPPLPFKTAQFNLVYAASVFTHLRLDLQQLWAWEVYRILQPGGILMMTLHGPQFFPKIYHLSHQGQVAETQMYSFGKEGLFFYLDVGGQLADQGQNEVAAVHNSAFVDDQFWMFKRLQWVSQSLLAGGQDLYILQKPLQSTTVAIPQFASRDMERSCPDAESASHRHECGRIPPDSDRCWVELGFQLEGQGRFCVYLQVEPAGFYTLDYDVDIVDQSTRHLLGHKRMSFNHNRVFGKTHYERIEMEITPISGWVTVGLMAVITDRGALLDNQTVHICWHFAHFV